MIDLQQFCPKWAFSEWMEKPFSRAGYTWATDGKMMVRMPLREDVPEHPQAAHAERVWPAEWPSTWRQPLRSKLPSAEMVSCDVCSGRGVKHKCPACTCTCETCGGGGHLEVQCAVAVGAIAIPLRHARLIVGLDWVELSPPQADDALLLFRFDGGEGIVTRLRQDHTLEVVAEI